MGRMNNAGSPRRVKQSAGDSRDGRFHIVVKRGGTTVVGLALIINLPFIALGYHQIGKKFAVKSSLAIFGLAICLAVVKYLDVTPDKFLTAVFGGFFIGAGIGLAIRGGIGSKGVSNFGQEILFCVLTRLEIGSIKNLVREIDPTAFITTHSLSDVEGGLIKKSALH